MIACWNSSPGTLSSVNVVWKMSLQGIVHSSLTVLRQTSSSHLDRRLLLRSRKAEAVSNRWKITRGCAEGGRSVPFVFSGDISSLGSSVAGPRVSSVKLYWVLERRHISILNAAACVAVISTAWLFFSAIPALLSFKRAAESLEQLLDVMAEELPETMAAIRVTSMEISDLTMELSDMGQEITQGVRKSTRAIHITEDRLRRLAAMSPPVQGRSMEIKETEQPMVAKSARDIRKGIVTGRAALGVLVGILQFSRWTWNFLCRNFSKKSP